MSSVAENTDVGDDYHAICPSILVDKSLQSIGWLEKTWERWLKSLSDLDSRAVTIKLESLFTQYRNL